MLNFRHFSVGFGAVLAIGLVSVSKSGEQPQSNPEVTFHAKPKALAAGAVTQDWPFFLGPTHDGKCAETKLLTNWPEKGPTLLWEMTRGTGYTQPVIVANRLVYFHRMKDEEIVECLHPETGERYWRFSYPTQYNDRYNYNNGPRSTPVIDGDYVYTYGAEGVMHCLKLASGEVVWKRDLTEDYKIKQNFFGVGTTPLLEGNLLIVNVGAPGGPCVVALDKKSGKQVWGADDPSHNWGPSYASPITAEVQGKHRLFVFAGGESRPPTGGLLCIDPANGAVDFTFPWRSKSYESVNAACPVIVGNQVFITASYQTGGALLDIQPDMSAKQAWATEELGAHISTPIHRDGYLYGIDGRHEENSTLACVELKSGKTMWHEALVLEETIENNGQRQQYPLTQGRGSCLLADGHFLLLGESGHLLWLDLTPQGHKQISRAWLFGAPQTWTPPVICHGLLYVTQNERGVGGTKPRLLCYDFRASE